MSTYSLWQRDTLTGKGRARETGLSMTSAKKKLKERADFVAGELGVMPEMANDMRAEFHCRNYMVVVEIKEEGAESAPEEQDV